MITLNIHIPTSLSEMKALIKEKTDKRHKYNKSLFDDVYKDICEELNSGYWRNDISEYMKKQFTSPINGTIIEIILKYKRKVK